jgi:hypothetical protein
MIRRTEQRGKHQGTFKRFKRALSQFIPKQREPFFQENHKQFIYFHIVGNKSMNEVVFPLYNLKLGDSAQGRKLMKTPTHSLGSA